jgi:hypothetical protein
LSPVFCLTFLPGSSECTARRPRHVGHLQVFDADQAMGFGLFCGQLMKKVFPGIGYGKMQLSYLGFGLLPVLRELHFPRHGPLIPAKPGRVLFKSAASANKLFIMNNLIGIHVFYV